MNSVQVLGERGDKVAAERGQEMKGEFAFIGGDVGRGLVQREDAEKDERLQQGVAGRAAVLLSVDVIVRIGAADQGAHAVGAPNLESFDFTQNLLGRPRIFGVTLRTAVAVLIHFAEQIAVDGDDGIINQVIPQFRDCLLQTVNLSVL